MRTFDSGPFDLVPESGDQPAEGVPHDDEALGVGVQLHVALVDALLHPGGDRHQQLEGLVRVVLGAEGVLFGLNKKRRLKCKFVGFFTGGNL